MKQKRSNKAFQKTISEMLLALLVFGSAIGLIIAGQAAQWVLFGTSK